MLAVGADAVDVAAGGLFVGHEAGAVDHAGEQVVLAPDSRHQRAVDLGEPRGIAGDDIERLAVGRQDHRVRAVLAAAIELAQELDLVEPVVVVGVA